MRNLIISIGVLFVLPIALFCQIPGSNYRVPSPYTVTTQIDEFGKLAHCDMGGRIDGFMVELMNNAGAQGVVINYQGTDVLPAEYGHSTRERLLLNHFVFRRFDRSRITFISGGFRESVATELWIVPPGGETPEPKGTVPEPVMPVGESFLFDKTDLVSEYSPDIFEAFVRPNIRAEEEAEWASYRDETDSVLEPDVDSKEDESGPTPEEQEDQTFRWVSIVFAIELAKRPTANGVLVFYADDHRYDIGKVGGFVSTGVDRLGEAENSVIGRVRFVFGGYRESPQVEYWIVPKGSPEPLLRPEERLPDVGSCEDVQ